MVNDKRYLGLIGISALCGCGGEAGPSGLDSVGQGLRSAELSANSGGDSREPLIIDNRRMSNRRMSNGQDLTGRFFSGVEFTDVSVKRQRFKGGSVDATGGSVSADGLQLWDAGDNVLLHDTSDGVPDNLGEVTLWATLDSRQVGENGAKGELRLRHITKSSGLLPYAYYEVQLRAQVHDADSDEWVEEWIDLCADKNEPPVVDARGNEVRGAILIPGKWDIGFEWTDTAENDLAHQTTVVSLLAEDGTDQLYRVPATSTLSVQVPGSTGNSFALACAGYGLWKCVDLMGIDPWDERSQDEFRACAHMVPADYCGNGIAMTKDGTSIDATSASAGPRPGVDHDLNSLDAEGRIEAYWGPSHAVDCTMVRSAATDPEVAYALPSSDPHFCEHLCDAPLGGDAMLHSTALVSETPFFTPPPEGPSIPGPVGAPGSGNVGLAESTTVTGMPEEDTSVQLAAEVPKGSGPVE